ncbi:hypothetical protein CLI92_00715 [Vandammella animalimorsus]|uniref:Uncharacterized protein n=1 Tax=Vandammella animalimorsus TaxID=2029117 RepID=A0A2A2T8Q4_9BURK|nr:hypothetical protein [Vandammella animalimorsus]PAT33361.1 hypothetical protein CK626_01000 [Vandammella animalimorsus]PAX18398.1 hypothetical protein CLI92_00715 [Vandammella animalimorsus]PAX20562.1 hypothetical protein CLI93_02135 [Vandammella animalimorsus]
MIRVTPQFRLAYAINLIALMLSAGTTLLVLFLSIMQVLYWDISRLMSLLMSLVSLLLAALVLALPLYRLTLLSQDPHLLDAYLFPGPITWLRRAGMALIYLMAVLAPLQLLWVLAAVDLVPIHKAGPKVLDLLSSLFSLRPLQFGSMLLGLLFFELSRLLGFEHKFRLWRAQQRAAKPSSD